MTTEEFTTIMESEYDSICTTECRVFLGLEIIRKYLPREGISGAGDDEVYSADVTDLVEAGITPEDVVRLRDLDWLIMGDYNCLYHFV